ncbi:hypothetical protein [Ghiorsea bivora]|uniref:hypothetical protein n=1 Tax=Ghiorsea bivora TaxID=1485545 RepID=UPI00056F9A1A|nr:hypothetical protein [Ghiorsea bivora]
MKKIILSAASLAVAAVASVSVAPTTSEAIPAFARQTGSACLACHFQSFPTLNAYGRAFKMGALTDVGDQALIEDEGLSIPAVVNWTAMVRPQFQSVDNGTTKANSIGFADQVFMVGGRGGEHTGVFIEFAAADVAGGGQPYANVQLFNSWDMGDMKVGATIWADGFGEDSGLQLMSVWGQHGGLLGGKSLTINGAMAGLAGGVGVTGWVGTDAWAAQLAMVDVASGATGVGTGFTLAPVLRGNYFLEAGDWEVGLGAIAVTGSQNNIDTKRTGIDVQAFGEVGDMQIGVFADYATAPKSATNVYATATSDRTGYSFRATVKPTHNLIFLAGLGQDKADFTIDKTLVGVEWEAYQNFVVSLSYNEEKTSAFGVTPASKTKTTLLDFELLI